MYSHKFGQRVNQLNINPIEKDIIENYFKPTISDGFIRRGKTKFLNTILFLFIFTLLFVCGIYSFLSNITSVKLYFLSLVSLTLVTGIPVFFTTQTITKFEYSTLNFFEHCIEDLKTIFSYSIYFGDKSISEYKYVYSFSIIYSPLVAFFSLLFIIDLGVTSNWTSSMEHWIIGINNYYKVVPLSLYIKISVLLLLSILLLRSIEFDIELKHYKSNTLRQEYKKWIFQNVLRCIFFICGTAILIQIKTSEIVALKNINVHKLFLPIYFLFFYFALNNILQMWSTIVYLNG